MKRLLRALPIVLLLAWVNPTQASIMNPGFESGMFSPHWDTIGTTSIRTAAYGTGTIEGIYHALIESGDASGTPPLGTTSDFVENFLGLERGALDDLALSNPNNFPPGQPTISHGFSEGSAIKQVVSVVAGAQITFSYNFLTNEPTPNFEYNDMAFVSVTKLGGPEGTVDNLTIIADTYDPFFTGSGTFYREETTYSIPGMPATPRTYTHTFDEAGTYIFGIGVANVNDDMTSSAIFVDNFAEANNDPVPEPGTIAIWSLLAVGGVGFAARRKFKKK